MFGSFCQNKFNGGVVAGPNAHGLFFDWKMSGEAFTDYSDYRVGSQTTHNHWWDTAEASWHGPILRVGGTYYTILENGQFASMHSPLDTSYPILDSVILVFHTNY